MSKPDDVRSLARKIRDSSKAPAEDSASTTGSSLPELYAAVLGDAWLIVYRAIGAERFMRFYRRKFHAELERGRIEPTDVPLEEDPAFLKMEAVWAARQAEKIAAEQELRQQAAHLEEVETRPVVLPVAAAPAPEATPEPPKREDDPAAIVLMAQRIHGVLPPVAPGGGAA